MQKSKIGMYAAASLLLAILFSFLAYLVISDFGYVTVNDVRFYGPTGEMN
ncbi:MAG: hypothetical protein QXX32_07285 [Thermofilum sp.]